MRNTLKKLYTAIKSNNAIITLETLDNYDPNEYAYTNREGFRKILVDNCIKIKKPIAISAGTKWKVKSSFGSVTGYFKNNCNIIGIAKTSSHIAVLDSLSTCFSNDIDGKSCVGYVELKSLNDEILEKIADQI